jgi:hypothetical protein
VLYGASDADLSAVSGVLAAARKSANVAGGGAPTSVSLSMRGSVAPGHRNPLAIPGPARRAGRHRARAVAPAGEPGAASADEMIIGIAAAARYLGYRKPDSFRRAHTRHPIPGEGKTGDGRPCWTPHALRSWQSKRQIAGNRADGGEPD